MSMGEMVVESATNIWVFVLVFIKQQFMLYVWPTLSQISLLGLVIHRIFAEAVLRLLEWRRAPRGGAAVTENSQQLALKDISATCQQLDIRLQQFCYWPIQYLKLRHRNECKNWLWCPVRRGRHGIDQIPMSVQSSRIEVPLPIDDDATVCGDSRGGWT